MSSEGCRAAAGRESPIRDARHGGSPRILLLYGSDRNSDDRANPLNSGRLRSSLPIESASRVNCQALGDEKTVLRPRTLRECYPRVGDR